MAVKRSLVILATVTLIMLGLIIGLPLITHAQEPVPPDIIIMEGFGCTLNALDWGGGHPLQTTDTYYFGYRFPARSAKTIPFFAVFL